MKFDACMTCGEMDLIELRLVELAPVVDVFVFVEASRTHAGGPKPLVVRDRMYPLAASLGIEAGRIRVVEVDDMPDHHDPWVRERHQRECIWRGLQDAKADDVLCFSDCDEIPRREAWGGYDPASGPSKCEQQSAYYWLNCYGGGWGGSIMAPVSWMRHTSLSSIRNDGLAPRLIPRAGWHFSFLGDVVCVRRKLSSYAHQECNLPHFHDERWLNVALHAPLDLFRRAGVQWRFFKDWRHGDEMPWAVRENQDRWRHLIKDAYMKEFFMDDEHLCWVVDTFRRVLHMDGIACEIGSWEGRSAVPLAWMAYPGKFHAVDAWAPSYASPGAVCSFERPVYEQFLQNVKELTPGNVVPVRKMSVDWCREVSEPIRWAFIDGDHHYDTVKQEIALLWPKIAPGGVLCGDDFEMAGGHRHDLGGGVQRAVEESFPQGFERIRNFWIKQRT